MHFNQGDDDELLVGAKAIAEVGFQGKIPARAVYHLAETDDSWGFFRLANKLAVTLGRIRAEIRRRESGGLTLDLARVADQELTPPPLRRTRPPNNPTPD